MPQESPRHLRLLSVLDHFGFEKAHFAGQVPSDFAGLIANAPERIASLTLVCPEHASPEMFGSIAERLMAVAGDSSMADRRVRGSMAALSPPARFVALDDYKALTWTDVLADHGTSIATALLEWTAALDPVPGAPQGLESELDCEGIHCTVRGSGPPLLLAPMALAPSQWQPVLDTLAQSFTTIQLSGPHLGIIPLLEARGQSSGYLRLLTAMIERLDIFGATRILDVGCGTGVVERWLRKDAGCAATITAVDINDYLLGEARWLAGKTGCRDLEFQSGDAESLPFNDDTFDVTFSATVMEEVDANRMLGELVRVTRPGGRVGVIVRALDLPRWTSLDLPFELKNRVETWPDRSEGTGCASANLYRLMSAAGLENLTCFPDLTPFCDIDGPVEQLLSMMLTAELDDEETATWQAARNTAAATGSLVFTWPHHCAVATKPTAS